MSCIYFGYSLIQHLYDVAGNKLRQLEYKEGILRKTTDFVANFVFINGKPSWYNFDEGRVVYKSEANYYAESYLKDHTSTPLSTGLGSVRVAFGFENGTFITRQVNSYYPFGMNIKGLTANSVTTKTAYPNEYLYNGKLMQDEMGLGWLDYRRRMYDLQLERWHRVDPLAEKYRRCSPYNYCVDNPMRFVDPDGMRVDNFFFDENGKLLKYENNDQPDKVYVKTGEKEIEGDNPFKVPPQPVFEEVKMTGENVEKLMDDNGYKKVTDKETAEVKEMMTYYTEADGSRRETSKFPISEIVVDQQTMFVGKTAELKDIKKTYLRNIERSPHSDYTIEVNVYNRTYDYNKKDYSSTATKLIEFISIIISGLY